MVRAANYGGSIKFVMKFTSKATSSDKDSNFGISAGLREKERERERERGRARERESESEGKEPLTSERGPFHLEVKVKFWLGSRAIDKILVQIV